MTGSSATDSLPPLTDRLDWPSLCVEMKVPAFPYNIGYWEGPRYFDIQPLRILIHETIHFWQLISMGFLTNLAMEVWDSLIEFENTGAVGKYSRLQRMLSAKDPEIGFSPLDLMETHARFWDIHILGPNKIIEFEREQRSYHQKVIDPEQKIPADATLKPYNDSDFDAAMTTGSYSEPYRRALQQWGTTVSVVMFPMAAYFALQTPNPIKVYKRIEQIVKSEVRIDGPISIHSEWRKFFADMRSACDRVSLEETGSYLVPGLDVLERSSLIGPGTGQNHVYWLYRLAVSQMTEGVGRIVTDQRFCFPGDPEYRGKLLGYALPPRVIMFDGQWTPRPLVADQIDELLKQNGFSGVSYASLAADSETINRRVRGMRQRAALEQIAGSVGGSIGPR